MTAEPLERRALASDLHTIAGEADQAAAVQPAAPERSQRGGAREAGRALQAHGPRAARVAPKEGLRTKIADLATRTSAAVEPQLAARPRRGHPEARPTPTSGPKAWRASGLSH